MGLYEGIKDVAKVIQQADNVELYKQLIDLSAQALDMQNEISRLSVENAEFKKLKDIENRIERHSEPFVTLRDEPIQILYCAHCWDYEKKLIQVKSYDSGGFKCTHCENNGIYDSAKYEADIQKTRASFQSLKKNRNSW
jgi:hypothetical protein